ncbi:oxygenase MpaB family protein [uncultured Amnibacterium sp.]|uniref:oxygenase MpaB family protein n=1 Tax=uncultured Amnibacterium sp. TaxID=1631851 RepID=UPI0035CB0B42
MLLTAPLRRRVLQVLSGQPTGVPEWTQELSRGTDPGYFAEGSAAWEVHRDIATLVAGPRALLLQALHPGAMAGVHDHSRYREDPLGRLNGTIRWITTVTYGSRAQAEAASTWVRRLHERVTGTYTTGDGRAVAYAAQDADLVSWVHLAFTDSFLRAFERYAGRPVPGGSDAYVRDWAVAGELMGVPDPPRSVRQLDERLTAIREAGVLRSDDRVREAVRFIRRPPLPALLKPTYPALFTGAVATLPPPTVALLGLRPARPVQEAATRAVLASTSRLLGEAAAPGQARIRLRALAGSGAAGRSGAAS